jgi:signal transduction histidine kinase
MEQEKIQSERRTPAEAKYQLLVEGAPVWQEFESIESLAACIAHHLSNVLTPIIGFSELLKMRLPSDDPLSQYADAIMTASLRAASLIRSLEAFSHGQAGALKVVDQQRDSKSVSVLTVARPSGP